jgi:Sulfotransferase family
MKTFQIKSSAQQLMLKARETTGISIIDADIEEALERLLQSLNTDAELHEAGATGMELRLLRLLCNRLRMQRDFKNHPEINDQQIVRPLFLTGGGRTGSTKLHKMLAASGDFIFLRFWQGHTLSLRSGRRDEDPADRIRDAKCDINWFDTHAPRAKLTHPFGTLEPEEELLIFEHGMFGPYITAFAFVPTFMQWWATQDAKKQFEFVKQGLKYVQWQFHDGDPNSSPRPWVLKCPIYPGFEPLLAELYPDATLVSTHRNPASTLSSTSSLLNYYHAAYSDAERKKILGMMMAEGLSMGAEMHLAGRDNHPELKLLDVSYTELTSDAERVLEKVYAHAGMTLSDKARDAMRQWKQENSMHKLGEHKHTLEDFGLTREAVQSKYSSYIERLGHYF